MPISPIDDCWHAPGQGSIEQHASVQSAGGIADMITSYRPAAAAPPTRVLVLYYSSYGHIEAMAYAEAEGAKQAGADVVVKRVPELVPEEVAQKVGLQARPGGPDRDRCRAGRLRRDHHRHADPLRQHGRADEELPRPDRRPVGRRTSWSARSAASSPRPAASMAARSRRSSRPTSCCCTSAW